MRIKKIVLVVGARPNFMKAAPLYKELRKNLNINVLLLHTGQHYDYKMSKVFFKDLDLPKPDYFLNVKSGSHGEQVAKILMKFEKVLQIEKPDLVVVFGDVNSTLAASLAAKKMLIKVAHVEAGLRSYDDNMPEEVNRRITDSISDFLFIPSMDAVKNLRREGIEKNKIYNVGNIMIDSLSSTILSLKHKETEILHKYEVVPSLYSLLTLHRPSNVDSQDKIRSIMKLINKISEKVQILFPVHPRTKDKLKDLSISDNIKILDPLGYHDFTILEKNSKFVITDSGGIQEETTYLNIPCLTFRENTERPITIKRGTNELVNDETLVGQVENILNGNWKKGKKIRYWDGKTAVRIADIIINLDL